MIRPTGALAALLEGEWDQVFSVVRQCVERLGVLAPKLEHRLPRLDGAVRLRELVGTAQDALVNLSAADRERRQRHRPEHPRLPHPRRGAGRPRG